MEVSALVSNFGFPLIKLAKKLKDGDDALRAAGGSLFPLIKLAKKLKG